MVVRMRHTRAHTRNRRSHHALKSGAINPCGQCKVAVMMHQMCSNCGYYKGKQVIDVNAKAVKRSKKKASKASAK